MPSPYDHRSHALNLPFSSPSEDTELLDETSEDDGEVCRKAKLRWTDGSGLCMGMEGTADWSMAAGGLGVGVTMFPVFKVIKLSEVCDVTMFSGKILKTCSRAK